MMGKIQRLFETLVTSFGMAMIITLITGLISNQPEASIIGADYYGYPMYWLVRMPLLNRTDFLAYRFFIDLLFFWIIVSVVVIALQLIWRK
ncbi:hypothetical protein AKJ45_01235 [candidate division MSBL1 archaeon SCGC-AAA261F19]|uniref:Uncharacterized protein n=1 Tax=candidate division MSBL1 archaeon SCGC-AAA261F19 TaxID=1698275 RepID=A0A133VAT7_9EURY|nr:hypothetical protein AKJ45_01235 [candidate division MSBL1 archaeon SCGC-AAA261F19]